MIRLSDTFVLAYTKLRTHRVRTGLTVGVAGILFGLILAVIIISQGIFDSAERFGKEGLGDRALVNISRFGDEAYNLYDNLDNESLMSEIEAYHKEYIDKKIALAKKYHIDYDAKTEDPSPLEVNASTKKKRIKEGEEANRFVQDIVIKKTQAMYKSLDIKAYLAPYDSAKIIPDNYTVMPTTGSLAYMKDGKEPGRDNDKERMLSAYGGAGEDPTLMVMNQTITKPFMVTSSFDASRGEVPVVVSYGLAEKLLGLKPLKKEASAEEKLNRLADVRSRVGHITASYCYRNPASQQLLTTAIQQEAEKKRNKDNKDYVAPSLQYNVPAEDSCGAVTIAKDTRTAKEKQQDERLKQYQQELGEYLGEPVEHKMVLRGVGISGEMSLNGTTGLAGDLVTSLLGSWLGFGPLFTIPADMLAQLPAGERPDFIFDHQQDNAGGQINERIRIDSYFVEFSNKQQARTALQKGGMFGGEFDENSRIGIAPFGSSSLIIDEAKLWLGKILLWALAIVGGVALIILTGLIGRMISDGRRESAVFRAIGARRSDIAAIYSVYAFLLSLRVVIFALGMGIVLALAVELLFAEDATVSARVAYAAADTTKEFHFFSLTSWYIPFVMGAIVVCGLLASIIPILLGARRNPITDMRNDA